MYSIFFIVFVTAAVVVLYTAGSVLSTLATPPSPPSPPRCLPDTDATSCAMLVIGTLMVITGTGLLLFARRLHRRDRDR